MKSIWIFLLTFHLAASAQQRFLVTPNDEVIPLKIGQNSSSLNSQPAGSEGTLTTSCGSVFTFGYSEGLYPPTHTFTAHHKDILAEWFIAKSSGTIDTIYWQMYGSIGAFDSIVSVRIFKSNIFPGSGPGYSPYPPPCAQWGYYNDANDSDQGITAFKGEATDSNWVSTVLGGSVSFDPLGKELWGMGGYNVGLHSGVVNSVAMAVLGESLHVDVGDAFFVTLRINSMNAHVNDFNTDFAASLFRVDTLDENYPSRNWKFYEHDSGPTICLGISTDEIKRGWVARGGFTGFPTDVAAFNIWYSMTVQTNVPPRVQYTSGITTMADTGAQTIDAEILDCDPYAPGHAGVKLALLKWQWSGMPQADIAMTFVGGLTWEGQIPGEPDGSLITFKVYTEDSSGLSSYGATGSYRVSLRITGIEEDRLSHPWTTALHPNFPNPFNPTTQLKYEIRDAGYVTVKIFDVLGREVATLVNDFKTPGEYSLAWDAASVPSGIYFCMMKSGTFSGVKKLMLVR